MQKFHSGFLRLFGASITPAAPRAQVDALDPKTLEIEIMETAARHDLDSVIAQLADLRAIGISVAMNVVRGNLVAGSVGPSRNFLVGEFLHEKYRKKALSSDSPSRTKLNAGAYVWFQQKFKS